MAKPKNLALVICDAEQELMAAAASIMQKHGLPCYLMELLVDKLHRRVIDGKAEEIAAARKELEEKE
jgi:hypothetical protein